MVGAVVTLGLHAQPDEALYPDYIARRSDEDSAGVRPAQVHLHRPRVGQDLQEAQTKPLQS